MTTSNGNGNRHGATDEKVNISTDPISPKSKKVYVSGTIHSDIKVPFREISLSASTTVNGNGNGYDIKQDESSLIVYDTSGPYTDPDAKIDIREGLDPIRLPWIIGRGDVEYYDGRKIEPKDDGYREGENPNTERFPKTRDKVLRAKPGQNVSQMYYAKEVSLLPKWNSSPSERTRNVSSGLRMRSASNG